MGDGRSGSKPVSGRIYPLGQCCARAGGAVECAQYRTGLWTVTHVCTANGGNIQANARRDLAEPPAVQPLYSTWVLDRRIRQRRPDILQDRRLLVWTRPV